MDEILKHTEQSKRELLLPIQAGETKIQKKTRLNKERMLQALILTRTLVTQACELAQLGRTQHYRWMNEDSEYAKQVALIEERTYDFVEGVIHDQIAEGNTVMTIFFAKTKMKHRGYIERAELEIVEKPAFMVSESQKGISKVMDVIHKKKTG